MLLVQYVKKLFISTFDCVHKSVLVILDIILFQVIYYHRQKRIEKHPNLEDDRK